MSIRQKWEDQIEILEKLKKTFEKRLENYQKEGDNFIAQVIDDYRSIRMVELEHVIEEIKYEIAGIQGMIDE